MDNSGDFECPKSLEGDLELIGNSRGKSNFFSYLKIHLVFQVENEA